MFGEEECGKPTGSQNVPTYDPKKRRFHRRAIIKLGEHREKEMYLSGERHYLLVCCLIFVKTTEYLCPLFVKNDRIR